MEDLGHVQLVDTRHDGAVRVVQLTDLHQWPRGVKAFEARGRVIDFDKEGYSTERNVELIDHVLETAKPDFVVLTGDILDGRPCSAMDPSVMKEVMLDVLAPVLKRGLPWTFCPGNHDDDHSPWSRQDLIELYQLPGCVSRRARGFDHTFTVDFGEAPSASSSVRLWMFDSGANSPDPKLRYTTFAPEAVAGYRALSSSGELAPSAVGLAYFHIPLPEYEGVRPLAGKNGLFDAGLKGGVVPFPFNHQPFTALVRLLGKDMVAGCSRLNSGIFQAFKETGNVRAMFVGHDHHCDWVGRRDGIYLCYGRCGGFTPPHNWEGAGGALPFVHGARLVEVGRDGRTSTWVTTFETAEEDRIELRP